VAGLSTYGLVWASFWYPTFTGAAEKNSHMSVLEEDASFFSSLSNSKRTSQSHRKHAIKEQGEASKRLRKHTPEKLRKSVEEAEEGFTTIGFWIIFILWGYQKVKERFPVSASSITERRPEWSTSSVTPPLQSQITTLQIRRIHREVIVRTLRRFILGQCSQPMMEDKIIRYLEEEGIPANHQQRFGPLVYSASNDPPST
jgi:hypothetical protein